MLYVSGSFVTVFVCPVRGHGLYDRQRTPNEWGGQPRYLSMVNIKGGRIQVSH